MNRLRAITERDRLGDVAEAIENGDDFDLRRVAVLQSFDVARAGRAALLDALEEQDKADERLAGLLGAE